MGIPRRSSRWSFIPSFLMIITAGTLHRIKNITTPLNKIPQILLKKNQTKQVPPKSKRNID